MEKKLEDRILSLEYDKETTERHYKELRMKVDNVSEDITAIKNAVIGNTMNGNIGMVTDIKKLKEQIFEMELRCIKYELYFKQVATVAALIVGALLTALIKIFL